MTHEHDHQQTLCVQGAGKLSLLSIVINKISIKNKWIFLMSDIRQQRTNHTVVNIILLIAGNYRRRSSKLEWSQVNDVDSSVDCWKTQAPKYVKWAMAYAHRLTACYDAIWIGNSQVEDSKVRWLYKYNTYFGFNACLVPNHNCFLRETLTLDSIY